MAVLYVYQNAGTRRSYHEAKIDLIDNMPKITISQIAANLSGQMSKILS